MKRVVVKVLAAMGLVPARRYDEMSRLFRDLMRERDDWKKRATKGARRERTLEEQVHDLERQLKKLQRQAPSAVAGTVGLTAMQARLADTERALAITREHLNVIEVKLQILEGAANVLDARTRVALQHQPDKTGAAVP